MRRLLAILLLTLVIVGCSSGYNATLYINQIIDSNPQHRLLTIGSFNGSRTDALTTEEATSKLELRSEVGRGDMEIELLGPEGDVIYSGEIIAGQEFSKSISGEFVAGRYKLRLKSKQANDFMLEILFR